MSKFSAYGLGAIIGTVLTAAVIVAGLFWYGRSFDDERALWDVSQPRDDLTRPSIP